MEDKVNDNKLSEALNGKYNLVGKHPGIYIFKGVKVDFRSCTTQEADKMIELGFNGLVKITPKDDSKAKESDAASKDKSK